MKIIKNEDHLITLLDVLILGLFIYFNNYLSIISSRLNGYFILIFSNLIGFIFVGYSIMFGLISSLRKEIARLEIFRTINVRFVIAFSINVIGLILSISITIISKFINPIATTLLNVSDLFVMVLALEFLALLFWYIFILLEMVREGNITKS